LKPIEHVEMALKLLEEGNQKYSPVWDCLIACKDDLRTIVQQPLSGSADASPKSCPNCGSTEQYVTKQFWNCAQCGHDFR